MVFPREYLKSLNFFSLDEIAEKSDFISIHVPVTNETRGMIDENFFSKMKNTAFLINTSRGLVVNEDDLIKALQEGIIAGAGLDVLEKEPPARDNPLLKMENVILTPHASAMTYEGIEELGVMAAKNVISFFKDKALPTLLNPDYAKNKKWD